MSDPIEQGEVHLDVLTDEPYVFEAKRQDETAWAYTRADVEAAVKRALEGAAEAVADYPRAAPDYDEWKLYDEQIEHAQSNIRALDPAQFIERDKQ